MESTKVDTDDRHCYSAILMNFMKRVEINDEADFTSFLNTNSSARLNTHNSFRKFHHYSTKFDGFLKYMRR